MVNPELLTLAYIIIPFLVLLALSQEDDDDDQGGGTLSPAYYPTQ